MARSRLRRPLLAGTLLLVACGGRASPPAEEPATAAVRSPAGPHSELWGAGGESWSPAGRLPDFSFAGYRAGEEPIPEVPVAADVRDFGARGDGIADDTGAFLAALDAVREGAVLVPAGRYRITRPLILQRSGVVLRGESRDATVLHFPKTLYEVYGRGRDGGPYGWSWGGAWIWANGDPRRGDSIEPPWQEGRRLATVTAGAPRGQDWLEVSEVEGIAAGQMVRVVQQETDGSLTLAMHEGHPLDGPCLMDHPGQELLNWLVEVERVEAGRLFLGRPLRVPVGPEWGAAIWSAEPRIEEVGIERLTVEFPYLEAEPHHDEPGQNAISLSSAYNSWVRDVAIVNFDNGIMAWHSRYCTVEGITLAGRGGHYGVNLAGCQDCLLTRFRIDNRSLHDLSVANLANGNVLSWGRGVAINFDHHRYAPYENLFSAIHAGAAWKSDRLWHSSGTVSGHDAAARETFWNIRPRAVTRHMPRWPALIVIGRIKVSRQVPFEGVDPWLERIADLRPPDLHLAQRARRLGAPPPGRPELPSPVPGHPAPGR